MSISADGNTELGEMLGGEDREYELAEIRPALAPTRTTLDKREQQTVCCGPAATC
jgi:RNA polymerase sigma-B factor